MTSQNMAMRAPGLGCLLALALLSAEPAAHAAGGHHAVDDAAILEPGDCELEGCSPALTARAGLRWAASEAWSVDLSRAHLLRGSGESSWTLGTSWQFGSR